MKHCFMHVWSFLLKEPKRKETESSQPHMPVKCSPPIGSRAGGLKSRGWIFYTSEGLGGLGSFFALSHDSRMAPFRLGLSREMRRRRQISWNARIFFELDLIMGLDALCVSTLSPQLKNKQTSTHGCHALAATKQICLPFSGKLRPMTLSGIKLKRTLDR